MACGGQLAGASCSISGNAGHRWAVEDCSSSGEVDLAQGLSDRPDGSLARGQPPHRTGSQGHSATFVDELDRCRTEQHHEHLVYLDVRHRADRELPHAHGVTVEVVELGSTGARAARDNLPRWNRLVVERERAGFSDVIHATTLAVAYSSSASSLGSSSSLAFSSSTFTSLKVSTRTDFTNRSER